MPGFHSVREHQKYKRKAQRDFLLVQVREGGEGNTIWTQILILSVEQCQSQASASQMCFTLGTCIKRLPFQLLHF